MVKQIIQDSFELVAELGQTTVKQGKKSGQQMAKQMVREVTGGALFAEKSASSEAQKPKNYTELDKERMDYLDKIHKEKEEDAQKLAEARQFFNRFISEGKQVVAKEKQEEEEKKRAEMQKKQEEDTKRKEKEKEAVPQAKPKQKRGMLFAKKVKASQPEVRGGSGKH